MTTTIAVSDETRELLTQVKTRQKAKSLDEVIRSLIAEHQLARFRAAQELVQRRANALGLKDEDLFPGFDLDEL